MPVRSMPSFARLTNELGIGIPASCDSTDFQDHQHIEGLGLDSLNTKLTKPLAVGGLSILLGGSGALSKKGY